MNAQSQLGQVVPATPGRRAAWIAALSGLVIAAGVIALWHEVDDRAHEHVDTSTRQAAHLMQLLITQDVDHRFSALDRLAQRWIAAGGSSRRVWEADATRYVLDMPGFASIDRLDAAMQQHWSVRDDDTMLLHDPDISRFDEVRNAVEWAHAASETTISDAFGLGEAGTCIAVILPVTREGRNDGVLAGVLQLRPWLDVVLSGVQTADHHVRVLLQGGEVYRVDANDESFDESRAEIVTFATRGLDWEISVMPASSFLSAGHADSSTLVLIVGLMLSALVAMVVYLALVARARSRQFQDSALRFEALIQNLPGMAYRRANEPGRSLTFVSEGCRALTGFSRQQLNDGRVSWDDLIHADDRLLVSREMDRAIDARAPFEMEYRIVDGQGDERWVWERGRLVDSEFDESPHVEGIVSDVTDRKRAESEARQHREHLAHVDRLNMLGEMATGIAHEINQPLTAISLFVQAGKRMIDDKMPEKLAGIFDKLIQHAHRASAVIERMQTMARSQESAKQIIACDDLIQEVSRLAEAEARIRDMSIDVRVDANLPAVEVDAVQIQQVVLNLLRNGMESMRSANRTDGAAIGLHARLGPGGNIEVSVVDCGTGVSDEVAPILFAPFSTTKKSGMGMGLSISRAIITAHGGRLDFRNNRSAGATFFFTLPPADKGTANEQ
jgi:PAS domain S-box-containing protein